MHNISYKLLSTVERKKQCFYFLPWKEKRVSGERRALQMLGILAHHDAKSSIQEGERMDLDAQRREKKNERSSKASRGRRGEDGRKGWEN